MSQESYQADNELRDLIDFAAGLGLHEADVHEIYNAVCQWAEGTGHFTDEQRLAEVRRQLIVVAAQR